METASFSLLPVQDTMQKRVKENGQWCKMSFLVKLSFVIKVSYLSLKLCQMPSCIWYPYRNFVTSKNIKWARVSNVRGGEFFFYQEWFSTISEFPLYLIKTAKNVTPCEKTPLRIVYRKPIIKVTNWKFPCVLVTF